MSVVPPVPGDVNRALAHLGRQVAQALLDRNLGDPESHDGWRGLLQDAADGSHQASGVLLVADEVYCSAHDLTTPAAVRGYAMSTLLVLPEGPGSWLLAGMLAGVEAPGDRSP